MLATDYAIEGNRRVVPVVIENCKIPRHLKALVTIDLSNPRRRERNLLRLRKLFSATAASSATKPSASVMQAPRLPSLRDVLLGRLKGYALSVITALGLIAAAQSALAAFINESPSSPPSPPSPPSLQLPVCSKKAVTSALREMMRQSQGPQRGENPVPIDGPGQLKPVDNGGPDGRSLPRESNKKEPSQERLDPLPPKPTFKEQKALVAEMVQNKQYRGAIRLGRKLLAKHVDPEVSELCFISLCLLGRREEGLQYLHQLPLNKRSKVGTICSNISPP